MVAVFNCKMRVEWFRCDVRAGVKKYIHRPMDVCNKVSVKFCLWWYFVLLYECCYSPIFFLKLYNRMKNFSFLLFLSFRHTCVYLRVGNRLLNTSFSVFL